MQTLKDKDLQLFEEILSLTQPELHRIMAKYLQKHYKKVVSTIDYVYAEGTIPIALVAHMDTVFSYPPEDIYYDRQKNAMWSPDGLGADDRVGVFLIIQIIRSGLRPHVILTTDEETGCIGASMLVKDKPKCPFRDIRYMIQLDRRGFGDCVFYDCETPGFEEYVEKFGFITNFGSFSDISIICPEWGIAGVNLSVGYMGEHQKTEMLFVNPMLKTLERVKNMLRETDIPKFKYVGSPYSYCYGWGDFGYYGSGSKGSALFSTHGTTKSASKYHVQCACCKQTMVDLETLPVKKLGGGTVFYCKDCICDDTKVDWCMNCGECYEIDPKVKDDYSYCNDCRKALDKNV